MVGQVRDPVGSGRVVQVQGMDDPDRARCRASSKGSSAAVVSERSSRARNVAGIAPASSIVAPDEAGGEREQHRVAEESSRRAGDRPAALPHLELFFCQAACGLVPPRVAEGGPHLLELGRPHWVGPGRISRPCRRDVAITQLEIDADGRLDPFVAGLDDPGPARLEAEARGRSGRRVHPA